MPVSGSNRIDLAGNVTIDLTTPSRKKSPKFTRSNVTRSNVARGSIERKAKAANSDANKRVPFRPGGRRSNASTFDQRASLNRIPIRTKLSAVSPRRPGLSAGQSPIDTSAPSPSFSSPSIAAGCSALAGVSTVERRQSMVSERPREPFGDHTPPQPEFTSPKVIDQHQAEKAHKRLAHVPTQTKPFDLRQNLRERNAVNNVRRLTSVPTQVRPLVQINTAESVRSSNVVSTNSSNQSSRADLGVVTESAPLAQKSLPGSSFNCGSTASIANPTSNPSTNVFRRHSIATTSIPTHVNVANVNVISPRPMMQTCIPIGIPASDRMPMHPRVWNDDGEKFASDLSPLYSRLMFLQQWNLKFIEVTSVCNRMVMMGLPLPVSHIGVILKAQNGQYISIDFGEHGTSYDYMAVFPLLPDYSTDVEQYHIELNPIAVVEYLKSNPKWQMLTYNCHQWVTDFLNLVCGLSTAEIKKARLIKEAHAALSVGERF
jgi:hypothetical protein